MFPVNLLQKYLSPIKRRIGFIVTKSIINLVKDSEGLQLCQVTIQDGEIQDGVPRVQDYGFTSHPEAGAQALVLCVGGYRNQSLIVKVDDTRYRKKDLKTGEVCLYSKGDNFVLLKPDGTIQVSSDKVELGSGALKALVNESFKDLFNNHTHPFTNASGTLANTTATLTKITSANLTSQTKAT